jgi:hypothetical protein
MALHFPQLFPLPPQEDLRISEAEPQACWMRLELRPRTTAPAEAALQHKAQLAKLEVTEVKACS